MKKHNINITNATTIEAHGNHTNGNTKKCYIVEKKMVCTSFTDAAEVIGCSLDAVSNVIRGKQRTCRGYHIIDLSKAGEAFPQMVNCLSAMDTPKAKAKRTTEMSRKELAEIRAKAKAYDKLMAEKEAKRKAEEREQKRKEKHEAEKVKLQAYISKRTTIRDKAKATMDAEDRKIMKAEQKLEALMDKEVL
jgi:hypothetical protein